MKKKEKKFIYLNIVKIKVMGHLEDKIQIHMKIL
jgi:hypothetical protein